MEFFMQLFPGIGTFFAVISLLVVAIIVGISKLTSRPGQTDDGEGEP